MPKPPSYNGIPIPYDDDIDTLCQTLKTPGAATWAACIALGHKTDVAALEILEQLVLAEDWRYRRIAIEAMAAHQLAVTRAALICQCLRDPSPYVVRTTCSVVAALKLHSAHASLRELAYGAMSETRCAALRALKELWQPTDAAWVVSLFQHDPSPQVRREAAWTLRQNVDQDTWERLFELWSADPLPRHRVWACELARAFGFISYIPILQLMGNDRDGHVRTAASQALAHLGG